MEDSSDVSVSAFLDECQLLSNFHWFLRWKRIRNNWSLTPNEWLSRLHSIRDSVWCDRRLCSSQHLPRESRFTYNCNSDTIQSSLWEMPLISVLTSLVWILVLFLIAIPIGFLMSFIYVFLQPFQSCGLLSTTMQFLLDYCIHLPLKCAENARNKKSLFWSLRLNYR